MGCPFCGGWHGNFPGPPPRVNVPDPRPVAPVVAKQQLDAAMAYSNSGSEPDPYELDPLPEGDGELWSGRVYGTDEQAVSYTHLTLPTIYSV